jgi:hypothetical protein
LAVSAMKITVEFAVTPVEDASWMLVVEVEVTAEFKVVVVRKVWPEAGRTATARARRNESAKLIFLVIMWDPEAVSHKSDTSDT